MGVILTNPFCGCSPRGPLPRLSSRQHGAVAGCVAHALACAIVAATFAAPERRHRRCTRLVARMGTSAVAAGRDTRRRLSVRNPLTLGGRMSHLCRIPWLRVSLSRNPSDGSVPIQNQRSEKSGADSSSR
jgi:hypothetical protein